MKPPELLILNHYGGVFGSMKLIAHRNETPGCPENSLQSLRFSASSGAYAVECDVRKTLDDEFVIYHDDTLLRHAGEDRKISDITLSEMRSILGDAGRTVMTLDELISGYTLSTPILLHIKEHNPYPALIARLLAARGMFILGIESVAVLRCVRDYYPKERLLAFMPADDMYRTFIDEGIGIIRLWEQWLDHVTPDMVHKAGAKEVWIMANTEEHGMDGTRDSLERFAVMGADGALVSDLKLIKEWQG